MSDIRISPKVQGLTVLGVLAAVAGLTATQLPEIKRYLKIKSM